MPAPTSARATTTSTMPRVLFEPSSFLSPLSPLVAPALAPGLAAAFLPDLEGAASSGSSASGSSTTNRYLHLGQSILRPTRLGSRMGTIASQLGHCCLKLVLVAINGSPPRLAKNGQGVSPAPPE